MAVAQLAAAVTIKQEPLDSPSTSSLGDPQLGGTSAAEGHTHPVEPRPVHPVELDERILNLCSQYPKGITDDIITLDQPQINTEQRLTALQRLLSQGKIDLLKQGSILVYRLKATTTTTSKTKGFEKEERLVYQIIEDSGNKGIWIREIRIKSNLPQQQIVKTLKTLESKKLIKSVKSVQQGLKKKVYMLADLAPDESVTGGAWYSDQDFESEFVEVLNQQCLKYLQHKASKANAAHQDPISRKSASYASSKEVCKFIMELGISKVRLTTENIETILNTLLYDGQAEVTVVATVTSKAGEESEEEDDVQRLYCATKQLLRDTGFSRVPCGVCPVLEQCCEGGTISPANCHYMKDWLKF